MLGSIATRRAQQLTIVNNLISEYRVVNVLRDGNIIETQLDGLLRCHGETFGELTRRMQGLGDAAWSTPT